MIQTHTVIHDSMQNLRSSGILLHPTSLPGKYGIGTLGKEAFRFIDFLEQSGQKYWQILPLGPTGYADSPYQCLSSFAGNPLLIDLELLVGLGLLSLQDIQSLEFTDEDQVDFGKLIPLKFKLLRKAFTSFNSTKTPGISQKYYQFVDLHKHWILDFAMFIALKDHFGEPWNKWEIQLKMRDPSALSKYNSLLSEEIEFHKFLQFLFFSQWFAVKEYASSHGISFVGDLPLYVAYDSADVWVHPELFQLDKEYLPVAVGGVPPDYFSKTGQLWGNPLYDWEAIIKDNGRWWIERLKINLSLYDVVRIDHFRGFAGYWSVPFGEKTAENGSWVQGPGKTLFDLLFQSLKNLPLLAEDLGVITEEVEELRDSYGFPGMKILQFAFDSNEASDHLPYTFLRNCFVYTGTHDNDTIRGWHESLSEDDRKLLTDYLNTDGTDICWDLIRLAWSSVADTAIVPMQDLLELGTAARMNYPGSAENNWRWRVESAQLTDELAQKLARITEIYGRTSKNPHSPDK